MGMQTIKKSIEVEAPKANVWDVILTDKFNRIWYAEFSEGTHAETDWKVGSKATFTDKSNCGLISEVRTNQPHEVLSLEYVGIVADGKEDYESDAAKAVKGGHETYVLSGADGITQLSIECDMGAEYFDMTSSAWDRALQKIKELSETIGKEK